MRWLYVLFVACLGFWYVDPLSGQCGFAIEPAADVHWYRADGWQLPGLNDAKAIRKINRTINGKAWNWPDGISVSLVQHDDDYRVLFPEAVFEDGGVNKRMLDRSFVLKQLLRWEINGKPYAYSYYLWPLDIACIATVDIIDDRGDGKFRVMNSPGHTILGRNPTPPPLPKWLSDPPS